MPPGLGLILFGGVGYLLVYASVAHSGRFATRPWAGLQEDAYTGNRSTAVGPDAIPPSAFRQGTKTPGATLVSGGTRSHHRRRTSAGIIV